MDNNDNSDASCHSASTIEEALVAENSEITCLRQQLTELRQHQLKQEEEFGMKRKKFMDLYKQKEAEVQEWRHRHDQVAVELEDFKVAAALVESQRTEEFQEIQRQYTEETASFQQIMNEAIEQALQSAHGQFQEKASQWHHLRSSLEKEVHELRSKLSEEREGFVASLAKSLQKKVASTGVGGASLTAGSAPATAGMASTTGPSQQDEVNLEDSMRKAQEDAEMLRSVVLPLEEEINMLKMKLVQARERLKKYEDIEDFPELEERYHIEEATQKVRELQNALELEQSSRADLETHVMTLKAQNRAAQMEIDRLRQRGMPGSDEYQAASSEMLSLTVSPPEGQLMEEHRSLRSSTESLTYSTAEDGAERRLTAQLNNLAQVSQCQQCSNYETQLQQLQRDHKQTLSQVQSLDRQLQLERSSVKSQVEYIDRLETAAKGTAEELRLQVTSVVQKLEECQGELRRSILEYEQQEEALRQELKRLSEGRESIQKELDRLQDENDSLIGKHQLHSHALNEEVINLPDSVPELHELLLRRHEELLRATVGREHIEETLRSELAFVRSQLTAETQERLHVEEALSTELSQVQSQYDADHKTLVDTSRDLEQSTARISQLETELLSAQSELSNHQTHCKQLVSNLHTHLEQGKDAVKKAESQVRELRVRNLTLQNELENSEDVQRDFVKLSQNLQVELEKIRNAGSEVRWQFEDDVDDCSNCRKSLQHKKKHHCRHCGRIFCQDCLTKTVPSGPKRRPANVCDVCHTILVKDATPYFSMDVPKSPL